MSLILAIIMVIGLLPSHVAVSASAESQTKSNVESVMAYADQLIQANQKTDYSKGDFSWDTENKKDSWRYFNGLMMDAFLMAKDIDRTQYVKDFYDSNIEENGAVKNYIEGELDSIEAARGLFDLLNETVDHEKYKQAIQYIYSQLEQQVVYEKCGGNYLHKQEGNAPVESWSDYQIGLDGLYMAQPFLMECANAIDEGKLELTNSEGERVNSAVIYQEVYERMQWVADHMKDESTGLYYHGWNSDDQSGNGHFWSRGIGWYAMAQVDIIEMMPEGENRTAMINALPSFFDSMLRYQDSVTGMWYNVPNRGSDLTDNKQETSGTAMMAYALMKAYNEEYVADAKYGEAGLKAFNGIVENKVRENGGNYTVADIYQKSGVGDTDEYYCTNQYVDDEAKGVGALIMAAALAGDTEEKIAMDSSENGSSELALDWKDIPSESYYTRVQSMEPGREYVILHQSSSSSQLGNALHKGSSSDVHGDEVSITSSNGQYSISAIDEKSTWYIDEEGRIYCDDNGTRYYLSRNSSYAVLTTSKNDGVQWGLNSNSGTVQFQYDYRYLVWQQSDFLIRNSRSGRNFYLYEKHSASGGQAALSGQLNYTIKTGSSLTEEQIKNDASVLYRANEEVDETVISWNEVDVSWNKALDTDQAGTYVMTVNYAGVVLGKITVEVKDKVLDITQPNWGLDPATEYPEYPEDGAVRIDKTAEGQDFNSTGVVKVELDTAGISVKQGVDVVLVVDVSNSMGWTDDWYLKNPDATTDNLKIPNGTAEDTEDKLDQAMDSASEFANILLSDNEDGSPTNNSLSFVTFAGYDANNTAETTANRNYIDSVQTVFTGVEDVDSANRAFSNTKFTEYEVSGTSVYYTLQISDENGGFESGRNRGNTNYDYAFSQANDAVEQLKASYDDYTETGRETIVIFMTDGAPSHYNGNRLNGSHRDTLYGTNEVYANVGDYNGNSPDNADTWLTYIKAPNGYAETLNENVDSFYAVGFDLNHGGFGNYSWSQGDLQPVLEGLAGPNSVDVELVETGNDLLEFYRSLATQIKLAGTYAMVTDTIDSEFTLQTTQRTGTGDENATHGTLPVSPTIEVTSYELYTKTTADDIGQIGTRTGESSVLEKITFNEDGTAAYSDQLGGENIMTTAADGSVVIKAKYFTYTKDSNGVEKFVWNIGDITDDEIVLSYYAYLTGSMEGTREKGEVYYTNEGATLEYVDINGDYAKKEFPMPAVAWGGATTSFEYYLVNEKGEPVNRAGQVIPFANRIVIYGDSIALNLNQDITIPAQTIEASDHLPEGYFLYDSNAYYTVSTASSSELDRGITISEPSEDAHKTTGESPNQITQTGVQTTIVVSPVNPTEDETYIQTRVAFGVRWDLTPTFAEYELVKNQIVMDYGKNIQADVVANDVTIPDGYSGKLVGFTAYNPNANLKQMQLNAGRNEYTTENGIYTIENEEVNFQPKKMLSQVERVFCVVQITETADDTNYYYLYEELDIIPATSVYYETDFAEDVFSFETTGAEWEKETVTDDIVADGLQDDGNIGLNQYGYDSSYANDKYQSNASSWSVVGADEYDPTATTSKFSFKGTGFDIISRTDKEEGFIRVSVYSDPEKTQMEKRVTVLNKSESELRLYQIPVVSIEDLTYGTHYVEIEVYGARESVDYPALSNGGQFHFDAVRIYDPINASASAAANSDAGIAYAAYKADGEANADIREVREMLLTSIDSEVPDGWIDEAYDEDTGEEIPGVIFVDRDQSSVGINEYKAIGPNNEVYLTSGQCIGFKLTVDGELPTSIDIGAKSANGKNVTLHAAVYPENSEASIDIFEDLTTSTSMYYDLLGGRPAEEVFGDGNTIEVYIDTNGTEGILSITDLKVAYGDAAGSVSITSDTELVKRTAAPVVEEEPNCDVLRAEFTTESIKRNQKATMQIVTGPDVEYLEILNRSNVASKITVDKTELDKEGNKVWTVRFTITSSGNQSYTVTGYDSKGNSGTSASDSIQIRMR